MHIGQAVNVKYTNDIESAILRISLGSSTLWKLGKQRYKLFLETWITNESNYNYN
jgi:hypothetical protein